MDILRIQLAQFGDPPADILSVRVKFPALYYGIENGKVWSGIGARACRLLPAAVVRGLITVEQLIHEIILAPAPVDQQILSAALSVSLKMRRIHQIEVIY